MQWEPPLPDCIILVIATHSGFWQLEATIFFHPPRTCTYFYYTDREVWLKDSAASQTSSTQLMFHIRVHTTCATRSTQTIKPWDISVFLNRKNLAIKFSFAPILFQFFDYEIFKSIALKATFGRLLKVRAPRLLYLLYYILGFRLSRT